MATTTTGRLTGERPEEGVTPDSLLALHAAGYQAVIDRLGPGRLLDVGCGQGFESVRLAAPDRTVLGVDYSPRPPGRPGPATGPRPWAWPRWTPKPWAWPRPASTGCARRT